MVDIFPDEDIICSFSENLVNEISTIVETQNIRFDSAIAKVTHAESVKSFDKLFKYRFFDKENLQIERSIQNYIVYIYSLTHHCPGLFKLRRLNT